MCTCSWPEPSLDFIWGVSENRGGTLCEGGLYSIWGIQGEILLGLPTLALAYES